MLGSLAERRTGLEVRWLGGARGIESSVVPSAGYGLDRLLLRSLRSADLSVSSLLDPLRLLASVPQAALALARYRPDVIFSTGGYVAIPVLLAAAGMRIPSLLWEGNRVPGRSVRATARLASLRAASFEATCARLPAPCAVTGTPIRDLRALSREEARAVMGLDEDVPTLLVFGGSQAVRRLNDAVAAALPELLEGWAVIHLTGESGRAGAVASAERLDERLRRRYRTFAFLDREMSAALVAADALVGRAGSSTLAEATALGLPLVVVPYPHAAGHQDANALEVSEAGAAMLVPDDQFDGQALLRVAAQLAVPAHRARAAAASRRLGRPGAAEACADLVLALAERRELPAAEHIEAVSRGEA